MASAKVEDDRRNRVAYEDRLSYFLASINLTVRECTMIGRERIEKVKCFFVSR